MKVLGNMPHIDFKVRSEGNLLLHINYSFLIYNFYFIYIGNSNVTYNMSLIIYTIISVIDDENPTVYTAGAIVTVTVSLTRKNMRHLFGDDSVNEHAVIDDNKVGGEAIDETAEEQNQSAKKPAWLKQKKGQKKSHKKGINKKAAPVKNAQAQPQTVANNTQQSNTLNAKKKSDKTEKESSKEKLSDASGSEAESDRSDDEDSHDKKDVSLDDDDTEWEKYEKHFYIYVYKLLLIGF